MNTYSRIPGPVEYLLYACEIRECGGVYLAKRRPFCSGVKGKPETTHARRIMKRAPKNQTAVFECKACGRTITGTEPEICIDTRKCGNLMSLADSNNVSIVS